MTAGIRKVNRKKRRRRLFYWIGAVLLLLVAAAGLYAYYVYDQLGDTVETIHEPVDQNQDQPVEEGQKQEQEETGTAVENKETLNFLLLGVDERPGDRGRSDTIVFLSANPGTESILMLSIPRDTRVEIPGHGQDKINHAYAFGGVELAIETVKNVLDTPIHFYVKMNMAGFQDIIGALDGVTVENQFSFTQGGDTFPAGEIHLNKEEALTYVRMRKQDPEGDFGRTERQRQVLKAALDEVASFSSITKVDAILSSLGENVTTNVDMEALRNLFFNYRKTRHEIHNITVNGQGGYMSDNIWYYQVPEEEWQRVHNLITDHMNASP